MSEEIQKKTEELKINEAAAPAAGEKPAGEVVLGYVNSVLPLQLIN